MVELGVEEICAATAGRVAMGNRLARVTGVIVDSREARAGDAYFALAGKNVDGHMFVPAALGAGATVAVVSRLDEAWRELPAAACVIVVPDTLSALGDLARYYRLKFDIPVVGVTGSVGKTTTKDMIAAALSRKMNPLKTKANLNTEIGVPLMLFGLEPGHGAAVLELAMRGPGQIRYLARVARPTIGVITYIGETHLELLGSFEKIAEAKAEVLEELPRDGLALLNGDCAWTRRVAPKANCRVAYYGFGEGMDVRAVSVERTGLAGTRFHAVAWGEDMPDLFVPTPGRHQVVNALAAVAVARYLGVDAELVREGLAAFEPTEMRMQLLSLGEVRVINDAYNASPTSTKAALLVLKELAKQAKARSVAVLGDMLELGWYSDAGHWEVGEYVSECGIDLLFTLGERASAIARSAVESGTDRARAFSFTDRQSLVECLAGALRPGDMVLVKASRGMKMEEVIEGLKALVT